MSKLTHSMLFAASAFGVLLFASACSDEKPIGASECPQNALCLYKNVSFSEMRIFAL